MQEERKDWQDLDGLVEEIISPFDHASHHLHWVSQHIQTQHNAMDLHQTLCQDHTHNHMISRSARDTHMQVQYLSTIVFDQQVDQFAPGHSKILQMEEAEAEVTNREINMSASNTDVSSSAMD